MSTYLIEFHIEITISQVQDYFSLDCGVDWLDHYYGYFPNIVFCIIGILDCCTLPIFFSFLMSWMFDWSSYHQSSVS